jgi:hypothetical protein
MFPSARVRFYWPQVVAELTQFLRRGSPQAEFEAITDADRFQRFAAEVNPEQRLPNKEQLAEAYKSVMARR